MTEPARLVWNPAEVLPAEVIAALMGPGGTFEVVEEQVLGSPVSVFAQRPRSMREVLTIAAEQFPDRPSLVFPDETVSYGELMLRVGAYAAALTEQYGVEPGDRVAIASANTLDYVLTAWAIMSVGAILTGLNGWWAPAELASGIELTQPRVVLGDAARLARLVDTAVALDRAAVEWGELAEQAALHRGASLPAVALDEDDPALILFTSGTTGLPKGALLSHRDLIHVSMGATFGRVAAATMAGSTAPVEQRGVQPPMLCASPLFHISGVAPSMLIAPLAGATVVFPPPGRWDPTAHLELTARHRVTTWSGVPTMFWRLLEHPDFDSYDVSCVVSIGSGGTPFPPELIRLLQQRFPGVRVTNAFGSSETAGAGTLSSGPLMEHHPDAVGRPSPCAEVEVRDDEGIVVAVGEVGEICTKSPAVFIGYWDNPDASEQAFWPGRWYRTGDFGRIEDGVLFIESRMRDLILRGGENVYPIEIEHRLIEHPEIVDAAVIGIEHRTLGQEVKAVIVRAPGSELTPSEIQAWVREVLAPYKVPAHVEFRDELPYTATGKVMKFEL